jgi:hypothetical protein
MEHLRYPFDALVVMITECPRTHHGQQTYMHDVVGGPLAGAHQLLRQLGLSAGFLAQVLLLVLADDAPATQVKPVAQTLTRL